jgi:EmrB/QacA subfamily drug resistance transporter
MTTDASAVNAPSAATPVHPVSVAESLPLSPLALMTVLLGVLLPMVDFFIVNVALPTMATDLKASSATLELVVSGYATTYAVFLVIGGRLGDARGRRRVFVAGIAAFTVASLLCGLAPSAGWLVAARILQGAAAALVVPQTLSTIQATGDGLSRARALGWFGATGGLAAVAGQAFGGWLISADIAGSGWRLIFLVNVPIGLVGIVLALRYVPETRAVRVARPDLIGAAVLAAAVVSLLLPLTEGQALGWPWWSWLLLVTSPGWVVAFAVIERRRERSGRDPLVPPSLLRHRSMRRGLALAAPFFAAFGAFMFVYALTAQGALGYSPVKAGLTLVPMAGAFLLASLQTARLVVRHGRTVITAGASLQLAGLLLLIWTLEDTWPHTSPWALLPAFTVMGFGQGLTMPSLIRVVLSEVPLQSAGAGSGVFTTMQQLALAIGVASLGTLFVSLSATSHLGVLHAAVLVVGVQAVIALGVAIGSRLLPRTG